MKKRGAFLARLAKGFSFRVRIHAMVMLGILVVGNPALAQVFGLRVTTATTSVSVNASVVFTINLTNLSGSTLPNVFVTNALTGSASVQIRGATTSQGTAVTNASSVSFNLGQMLSGGVARMTVTNRPTSSGAFTNRVNVASTAVSNTASTNVVVQVIPPTADLALSLTGPSPPVLVGDWITYDIAVTNSGTNSVANVMLTNTGFSAMTFIGLAPTNQSYTLTNGLLVLNIGTLAGGGGVRVAITAQPTNAGVFSLTSSVSSTNITESNSANNTASNSVTVEPLVLGQLIATNASPMVYNPQTGLMEQTIRLANIGTNSVASARVIVSGLTNRLYNAVGSNNGNPFVVYSSALDPSQSVDLAMEYFIPTRLPITVPNSAYTAVGTSAVNLSPPSVPAPNITLITNLASGALMIEFESVPGRSYTILYSDNNIFTNALAAQPAIVAPADRVQWIDNGPPKTISHPTTLGARFYRVQLNP